MAKEIKKIQVLLQHNRMWRRFFCVIQTIILILIISLYYLSHFWYLNNNLAFAIFLYLIVTSVSAMTSRLHDIWYSGWLLLLQILIPWFIFYLFIKKWNKWKNIYGKHPKKIIKKIEKQWD